MNRSTLTTLLVLLIITALAQSVVIVRDTEKAILLKLGAFERTLDPGLNFKIPFIDNVIKFEGRLRSLDTPPDRVLSNESKPLNVDASTLSGFDSFDKTRSGGVSKDLSLPSNLITLSINGILKLRPGSRVLSKAPSFKRIAFSVSRTITTD